LAGGNSTEASGKNSLAFGEEAIAKGDNSIALGKSLTSSPIRITPIDNSTFTFNYNKDKIYYTQYRLRYTPSDGIA
jgi:autotransporter adhesin